MRAAGRRLRAGVAALALVLAPLATTTAHADPANPTVGGPSLATRATVSGRGAPAIPTVSAAGWVVADAETGEVLGARNPHGRYLPASTLKTLTAVALIPEVALDKTYTTTYADVNVEGSKVGLVQGMRYPVAKLLESMLVVSGNDAANALASAAGGLPHAVTAMNDTAKRLQAYDTVARNPSGLDAPGQVTSAYDLALIARAGLTMPVFVKYAAMLRDTVPAPGGKRFEIFNHNKLLTRYRGAIGIKTGYTVAARHTYVGAARRGGHTLIVTLMHAESMYEDAIALLDWGFASLGRAIPVGRLVEPMPRDDDNRADRSRTGTANTVPAAAPKVARAASRTRLPAVPAAGAVLGLGCLVALRRRAVRRRYRSSGSGLKLRLPVR